MNWEVEIGQSGKKFFNGWRTYIGVALLLYLLIGALGRAGGDYWGLLVEPLLALAYGYSIALIFGEIRISTKFDEKKKDGIHIKMEDD